MKKYLAIIFSFLFVLGLTTSAFAIHAEIPSETQAVVAKGATQITLGGSIRARGEIREIDFNDDTTKLSHMDLRVRLSVAAKVTENTTGLVEIQSSADSGSADFSVSGHVAGTPFSLSGTVPGVPLAATNENQNWGANSTGNGLLPRGNAMGSGVRILQAWLQYAPGMWGVKVGHMPLKVGNGIFLHHTYFSDDAIVVFANPTKETHISAIYAKWREGGAGTNDDTNAYIGIGSYSTDMFSIGADVTYVDDQDFRGPTGTVNAHLVNIGLRGDVKVAGLTLRGDAAFQTGEIDKGAGTLTIGNASCAGTGDCDFKGYGIIVGADYKLGPAKLTAEFAYGSGDDNATDSDIDMFITTKGAFQKSYTYVYDYRLAGASGAGWAGIANTTYVKVGASSKLTKALSGMVDVYWLKATEKFIHPNRTHSVTGAPTGPRDDDLGWEIDGKITYSIDRNLKYWVEGGFLIAGEAFDRYSDAGVKTEADNAYAVRHGIQLAF